MRPTAVFRNGEWIPTDVVAGDNGYPTRPSLPVMQRHISDDLGCHLKHMANGEHYDSKSRFRQATRDNDCIEVGHDPGLFKMKPDTEPKGVEETVARAYFEHKLVTPTISEKAERRRARKAGLAPTERVR